MARVSLLEFCDKINLFVRGPLYRTWGKSLIRSGLSMMGNGYAETGNPSLRGIGVDGVVPELESTYFVAPNSTIIGNVSFGNESSTWYGSILRAETNRILIGERVVIQDNTKIYSTKGQTVLGDNVLVGPNCTLNSCTIEDDCFIGPGAFIGNGAYIEAGAFVAAGSIIPDGVTVPSGEIWVGSPAVSLRPIEAEERENFAEQLDEAIKLSVIHNEETKKTMRQVIDSEDMINYKNQMDFYDRFARDMMKRGYAAEEEELQYMDQKLDEHYPHDFGEPDVHYEPYEQDLSSFPDSYKKYSKNFERYEDLQNYFEEGTEVMPEFLKAQNVNNREERAKKF